MDHRRQAISHRHAFAVPAVLAGLAVAVPLAAAAGPAVGGPRSAAVAGPTERAEQLIQYVSEAARQWCGSQAAVTPDRPRSAEALPSAPRFLPSSAPYQPEPPEHVALPQLIDLPPPTC